MGKPKDIGAFGGLDAVAVCGCDVLWGGIYATDIGAEEGRPNSGVADIESGIGVLGVGRMGDIEAGTECEGAVWVWADVFGDCVGAVAAEKILTTTQF